MTGILIANCTANHKRMLSLPSVCAVILLRFGSSGTRARFLYAMPLHGRVSRMAIMNA